MKNIRDAAPRLAAECSLSHSSLHIVVRWTAQKSVTRPPRIYVPSCVCSAVSHPSVTLRLCAFWKPYWRVSGRPADETVCL